MPPTNETITDSVTIMASTDPVEKPRVFITATSRVRSRTDMDTEFAFTSKIVKTNAVAMLSRKSLMLPIMLMNESMNAFSVSVLVGCGALRNILSIVLETRPASSAARKRTENVLTSPRWPGDKLCCRYSQ